MLGSTEKQDHFVQFNTKNNVLSHFFPRNITWKVSGISLLQGIQY